MDVRALSDRLEDYAALELVAASHHVTYVFPENSSVLCDFAATSGARVRGRLLPVL